MKKLFIVFTLLFLTFSIFSVDHYLGISNQINTSGIFLLFIFEYSIGFNYNIIFSKYFSLENIIFIGYSLWYSGYFSFSTTNAVNIIFNINPILSFGNDKIKFFFSLLGLKFYSTFEKVDEVNISQSDDYHGFNYTIAPGFNQKIGLDLFFKNNIVFTPVYLYCDIILIPSRDLSQLNPIPLIGSGINIKFKIGK